MKIHNFLYKVNSTFISKHFRYHHDPNSPYFRYISKKFGGVTIRTVRDLIALEQEAVVMSVRYSGRNFTDNKLSYINGIKIDLIELDDSRIEEFGIEIDNLELVTMNIERRGYHITEQDSALELFVATDKVLIFLKPVEQE